MKQAILVLALAALLGGCVSTAPAVVATLDGKPRIPVNKTIPAQPPLAQPSPADTQED